MINKYQQYKFCFLVVLAGNRFSCNHGTTMSVEQTKEQIHGKNSQPHPGTMQGIKELSGIAINNQESGDDRSSGDQLRQQQIITSRQEC